MNPQMSNARPTLAGTQAGIGSQVKGTAPVSPIHLPSSIDEAIQSLSGIDSLLTAKEWERAAIVWAFTTSEVGRPPAAKLSTSGRISITELTRLGIKGLRSREIVIRYRKAWEKSIADGHAADVRPGDRVNLPEVPWSDYYIAPNTGWARASEGERQAFENAVDDDTSPREAARIAKNHGALVAAIKADPKTAEAAANALAYTEPHVRERAARRLVSSMDASERLTMRDDLDRASRESVTSGRLARAEEREEAERKSRGDLRATIADGHLIAAKRKIREAIIEIHEADISADDRDALRERIAEVSKVLDTLRAEVDGKAGVDWDAELAAMMGGE